jgi:hypothetical protein
MPCLGHLRADCKAMAMTDNGVIGASEIRQQPPREAHFPRTAKATRGMHQLIEQRTDRQVRDLLYSEIAVPEL